MPLLSPVVNNRVKSEALVVCFSRRELVDLPASTTPRTRLFAGKTSSKNVMLHWLSSYSLSYLFLPRQRNNRRTLLTFGVILREVGYHRHVFCRRGVEASIITPMKRRWCVAASVFVFPNVSLSQFA